ncbi:MAG: hypothetical protein E7504_08595 [Ruminococcus sp.]|nr:hypothetical protein [Ruminococcus sp.]
MKEHKFYNELPPMICLAGDTIGPFLIALHDNGQHVSTEGCTMRVIIAASDNPTVPVLNKECTAVEGGFEVTITSAETVDWNGDYDLHFALYDASGLIHRKLYGTLHVKPVAKGGSV